VIKLQTAVADQGRDVRENHQLASWGNELTDAADDVFYKTRRRPPQKEIGSKVLVGCLSRRRGRRRYRIGISQSQTKKKRGKKGREGGEKRTTQSADGNEQDVKKCRKKGKSDSDILGGSTTERRPTGKLWEGNGIEKKTVFAYSGTRAMRRRIVRLPTITWGLRGERRKNTSV